LNKNISERIREETFGITLSLESVKRSKRLE